MKTRSGETRRTSSTHRNGEATSKKTGGMSVVERKKKSSEMDDVSSVASSTRTRSSLRSLRNGTSREPSQEPTSKPSPPKRGRPKGSKVATSNGSGKPSNKVKNVSRKTRPQTKYFQDSSSDGESERSGGSEESGESEKSGESEVTEKAMSNRKKPSNKKFKCMNNNTEPPSNRRSRRSSRVSSVASSAASSALSSLISVRNEKKEKANQFKQVLNENLKKILNGSSNGHESEDEDEDESDDEYERAIYFGTSAKKKRAAIVTKKDIPNNISQKALPVASMNNFHGYSKQVSLLRSLIRSALEQVESNTILVVGSSGSGKSALVNHCLNLEDVSSKSLIIRLHGFVETDESMAFKSINQQLENISTASNTIPDLMELLIQDNGDEKTSFIILLDKFDVFCRKNQTLLYNLFDITRKCKHILVIGSTTRIDAPELLEKRVKSRMNQIMIHLASPFENVEDYIAFAKTLVVSNYGMDSLPEEWIPSLKQLYSQTPSIRELNKFILQRKFLSTLPPIPVPSSSQSSQSVQSQDKNISERLDTTSSYLSSLSYLELGVLVSVFKSCKARDVDTITTFMIIKLASSLPSQMVHDRSMLFKVINNLIDYGFFYVVTQITARSTSHMNERTQLGLNIDERTLKQTLFNIQNSIPSNLKNLLVL